jgi:hypothetical protein
VRRSFSRPPAPRTPLRYLAAALAVEAAFVVALLLFRTDYDGRAAERSYAYLLDIPPAPRSESAEPAGGGRNREPPRLVVPRSVSPAIAPPAVASGRDPNELRPFGADSLPLGGGGRPGRRSLATLGPRFGDGRLWVRPDLSYEFLEGSRRLNLDSVVRLRLLAMADSIERHPTPDPNRPTRWIFERNGRTYGMDENGNIHLGGITIPGALLALIPMPQGNIDQARANQRLAAMRADIMRAAARAQAEDDFRRAVQQIRERTQRERRERQRERQPDERPIP